MRQRFSKRKFFIFIIPFALLGLAAFTVLVMLLWNNILVQVLHVSAINFWQSLGILALSKILFGGFRGGQWGKHQWGKKMSQRWDNMTPEEKEKFRGEWEKRCGRRFERPFEEETAKSE